MFSPAYKVTKELLLSIAAIERLYGQIEALKIPHNLELNLTRQNLITSSYASNKIEGNPLTLPEVTNLLLNDRVPANRSEKEVVNYFSALKQLPQIYKKPLDLDLILSLHKNLLQGVDQSAGTIRNIKVVVGRTGKEAEGSTLRIKHDPPFHTREEISLRLSELLSWVNSNHDTHAIIRAGIFHHQFVYIHPFEDGNGRICRLLTALLLIKSNYLINRYFILDDYYDIDRIQYSDMLHTADSGDQTVWLQYFCEGIKYSLQSALQKLKISMRTLSVTNRPSKRELEVLTMFDELKELTSADVVEKLKVTRQQAHHLLTNLIEKGFLLRKGSTKSSYYIIK